MIKHNYRCHCNHTAKFLGRGFGRWLPITQTSTRDVVEAEQKSGYKISTATSVVLYI